MCKRGSVGTDFYKIMVQELTKRIVRQFEVSLFMLILQLKLKTIIIIF